MPVELIKFNNVKLKYYLNEDILLEYVLNAKIRPSSRDWIGLYPCGWENLHNYITFEWLISRPCEVALQRNVRFDCKYHSQDVQTDKKYQFIYVNKKLEVLGHSRYFRFQEADHFTDRGNNIHNILSEKVKSSVEQIHKLDIRIQDLENDLQESYVVQKQLELSADHSERQKLAYKKFVSDLISALSQKGIARLIDCQGSEMLVKKVSSDDIHHSQNAMKPSDTESLLKAVDSCQDQMVELQTTVQNNIEEEGSNGYGGTRVEVPEPERGLNDQQTNVEGVSVSGLYETAGHSKF